VIEVVQDVEVIEVLHGVSSITLTAWATLTTSPE